ncbi:unnamed protein product [Pedinophyceae sp. YPF-701]|nr:unnamed protein product [Pedinophyceae sp. YPF-701]
MKLEGKLSWEEPATAKKSLKLKNQIEELLGPDLGDVDDDECCPTCLDPYDDSNPKMTTRCGHHFHLPCILEWRERSRACPVCGKKLKVDGLEL